MNRYEAVGGGLSLFHGVYSSGFEPPVRPQVYHDDGDVVLASLLEGKPGEVLGGGLGGGVGAATPLRWSGGGGGGAVLPVPGQNPLAGRGAGLLVGHDVPQAVGGEDEAVVLLGPGDAVDFRVRDYPRLQIPVP